MMMEDEMNSEESLFGYRALSDPIQYSFFFFAKLTVYRTMDYRKFLNEGYSAEDWIYNKYGESDDDDSEWGNEK